MANRLFLLALIAWAGWSQVDVHNNEVWIQRDGRERQLTNDGKSKYQAVLSPAGNRVAYYEACQSQDCTTSVVILDADGRRLKSFQPMAGAVTPPGPCGSIWGIWWPTEGSIAVDCNISPSTGEYVETDLATGKTVRDLLGMAFTPSPDRRYVAHVGPIVHFAAPIDQSYYLYIDNIVVYPLPRGAKPSDKERKVLGQKGERYTGVHEFVTGFFWSPDSERVAFVDCLFDWIEKGVAIDGATPIGDETNRRCFVAVVARTGQASLFPVEAHDAGAVRFSWDGPNQLSVQIAGASQKFRIP